MIAQLYAAADLRLIKPHTSLAVCTTRNHHEHGSMDQYIDATRLHENL